MLATATSLLHGRTSSVGVATRRRVIVRFFIFLALSSGFVAVLRYRSDARMRLVGHFAALSADNITSLLLLNVLHFLLARLVNLNHVLLNRRQLLSQSSKSCVETLLVVLVLVELIIQEYDLLLIADLLFLIERFLEHDAISFVL